MLKSDLENCQWSETYTLKSCLQGTKKCLPVSPQLYLIPCNYKKTMVLCGLAFALVWNDKKDTSKEKKEEEYK